MKQIHKHKKKVKKEIVKNYFASEDYKKVIKKAAEKSTLEQKKLITRYNSLVRNLSLQR